MRYWMTAACLLSLAMIALPGCDRNGAPEQASLEGGASAADPTDNGSNPAPPADAPLAAPARQVPDGMQVLSLELPAPRFRGTPPNLRVEHLEPERIGPRGDLLVPVGTRNLALGRPVTSSDPEPIIGELVQITNGDKEATEGSYVELGPGLQWVQIDLGEPSEIYAIAVWHYHADARIYHDVIVQVSSDPDFIEDEQTVFNNDHDNSAGMGIGEDHAYVDNHEGRLIDAGGAVGRYVRLYSNGSTADVMNHYTEVEVYGRAVPRP